MGVIKISDGCMSADVQINHHSIYDMKDLPPLLKEVLSYYTLCQIITPISEYSDDEPCDSCGDTYREEVYDIEHLVSALEEAVVFLKAQGD